MRKGIYAIVLTLLFTTATWAHDAGTGIHVDELVKTTASWNGALLPAYDQGTPEVTILKITIAPKTELPMHEHPVINAGVLLKGS